MTRPCSGNHMTIVSFLFLFLNGKSKFWHLADHMICSTSSTWLCVSLTVTLTALIRLTLTCLIPELAAVILAPSFIHPRVREQRSHARIRCCCCTEREKLRRTDSSKSSTYTTMHLQSSPLLVPQPHSGDLTSCSCVWTSYCRYCTTLATSTPLVVAPDTS